MKTILVPTDYSRSSKNALRYALELASRAKAEIVLLHVFHQPLTVNLATHLNEALSSLEKEKNLNLEAFAAEVQTEICQDFSLEFISTQNSDRAQPGPDNGSQTKSGFHVLKADNGVIALADVKIKCITKFGYPSDGILKAVETYQADLVVMGRRGAGVISQAFMGSTVAAVIEAGVVPVLALPTEMNYQKINSLVFSSDLSEVPSARVLKTLRELVKLFSADLKILHLYGHPEPKKESEKILAAVTALDEQLPDLDFNIYIRQRDNIAQGIQEFVQAEGADLLVLVPKHHSFLEKLLRQSVTGQLSEHPFIPLLTLPSATQTTTRPVNEKAGPENT